jgi:hypothetical protein
VGDEERGERGEGRWFEGRGERGEGYEGAERPPRHLIRSCARGLDRKVESLSRAMGCDAMRGLAG